MNTRLKKLEDSNWCGAIFAAAGLQRLGLRQASSIELDWMIPAPAQGAILVVCRENEKEIFEICHNIHHASTAFCVKIERDFLAALLGGCSTPIGALAETEGEEVFFKGNLLDPSGDKMFFIEKRISVELAASLGTAAAHELLSSGGQEIIEKKKHV